jgi:hypothetical protein
VALMGMPTWRVGPSLVVRYPAMVQLILEAERYGLPVAASPGTTWLPRRASGNEVGTVDSRVHWVQTWQVPMAWTIGTWLGPACGMLAVPPPGRAGRA